MVKQVKSPMEVIVMEQMSIEEHQHLKLPERKNHSSHMKWDNESKMKAMVIAKKSGFGSLSAYSRYMSNQGYFDMFIMIMELHNKMVGDHTTIRKKTKELREHLCKLSRNSNGVKSNESDKLVENILFDFISDNSNELDKISKPVELNKSQKGYQAKPD